MNWSCSSWCQDIAQNAPFFAFFLNDADLSSHFSLHSLCVINKFYGETFAVVKRKIDIDFYGCRWDFLIILSMHYRFFLNFNATCLVIQWMSDQGMTRVHFRMSTFIPQWDIKTVASWTVQGHTACRWEVSQFVTLQIGTHDVIHSYL